MITLLPAPPANNVEISFITSMLNALADPAASAARLAEMLEARTAWVAAYDAATIASAESAAQIAADRAALAKERLEHDAALAAERAECMRQCAADMERAKAERAEAKELRDQAKADADAAAALKSDYERRLSVIRSVAE